jgi:hypothetical protein
MAYTFITSQAMSASDIANLVAWTNANWGTSFSTSNPYSSSVTLDPAHTSATLSGANLVAQGTATATHQVARSTTSHSSGKYYVEYQFNGTGSRGSTMLNGPGLIDGTQSTASGNKLGQTGNHSIGLLSGGILINGGFQSGTVDACPLLYGSNVADMAVDFGAQTVQWYSNGTLCATSSIAALTPPLYAAIDMYSTTDYGTVNFGATNFFYPPPSGYSPW